MFSVQAEFGSKRLTFCPVSDSATLVERHISARTAVAVCPRTVDVPAILWIEKETTLGCEFPYTAFLMSLRERKEAADLFGAAAAARF